MYADEPDSDDRYETGQTLDPIESDRLPSLEACVVGDSSFDSSVNMCVRQVRDLPEAWLIHGVDGAAPAVPEMRAIDQALRCPICGDFFQTAVIIRSCAHAFCSLCIRRSLSYSQQCPVCKAEARDVDLTPLRSLESVTSNFAKCREKLLDIVLAFQRNQSSVREMQRIIDAQRTEINTLKLSTHSEQAERREVEGDFLMLEKRDHDGELETGNQRLPDGVVRCPVCEFIISENLINQHLNICLSRSESAAYIHSTSRKELSRGSQTECLPLGQKRISLDTSPLPRSVRPKHHTKIVYNIMSTSQLKKLAADCHLNTKCTRNSLIAKHKEFVIRYNADIDAGRPPDSKDIAMAIEREDSRKQSLGQHQSRPCKASATLAAAEGCALGLERSNGCLIDASFESLTAELREKQRVAREKIDGAKYSDQNSNHEGESSGGGGCDGEKSPVVALEESNRESRESKSLEGLELDTQHDPAQC